MRRSDIDRLNDIADAIAAIHSHLRHGPISRELVMDAVAMRLLEIGEAVKSLTAEITDTEPGIRWRDIAGMRDFLAHHYFSTSPGVVQAVIDKDLQPLADAVQRMRNALSTGNERPPKSD
ncbi:HepT-like ribonuclease domain-containing protein [Ruania alba]|uniref:Uncharacterized conserved protein, contains HEPN domain n=1 Tax=Ruania alba TaxID=648782 RepID=A0A1H5MBV2_9MICO|nr:HepT-like ribonuclease domain-containing protein [Ruania alba]SEE86643.1 Uncharacterized conserved protein, contains HEPN domain [Ruania alba]